jgi:capsular polysaccharide transport system ATP-binding protein
VDEVTEVGDARFREKCAAAFRERAIRSDIIMVSHNSHTIRAYCDRGAVLADGRLELFDSIEEAVLVHRRILGSVHA